MQGGRWLAKSTVPGFTEGMKVCSTHRCGLGLSTTDLLGRLVCPQESGREVTGVTFSQRAEGEGGRDRTLPPLCSVCALGQAP